MGVKKCGDKTDKKRRDNSSVKKWGDGRIKRMVLFTCSHGINHLHQSVLTGGIHESRGYDNNINN